MMTLQENEYLTAIEGEQLKITVLDSTRLTVDGREYSYDFVEAHPGEYSLLLEGKSYHVAVGTAKDKINALSFEQSLYITLNSREYSVEVDDKRSLLFKSLASESTSKTDTTVLKSPMPGLVVKVEVQLGDEVHVGQGLIVLEAMKMENELKAGAKGKITSIHASAGKTVEKGESLLTISHL